jgi:hypothetical protein
MQKQSNTLTILLSSSWDDEFVHPVKKLAAMIVAVFEICRKHTLIWEQQSIL